MRILAFSILIITGGAWASAPTRVMIDPGHGGDDHGAQLENIQEKTIALNVGLELNKLLLKDKRFVPLLTRDKDEYILLAARPDKAVKEKADVFVSIHANSSPISKARGTEFYFENQVATDEETQLLANRENNVKALKGSGDPDEKTDLENIMTDLGHNEHMMMSQQLSQILLESFQGRLNIKTRAIRQAPFHVLSVPMPSTLIELGFVSNPEEAHWLAKPEVQKKMARAIYAGLKRFKEKLDKVHKTTLN
jgi:N-acetylmuramoyl-L-alanine amidase